MVAEVCVHRPARNFLWRIPKYSDRVARKVSRENWKVQGNRMSRNWTLELVRQLNFVSNPTT
jgi:hypothetical protein